MFVHSFATGTMSLSIIKQINVVKLDILIPRKSRKIAVKIGSVIGNFISLVRSLQVSSIRIRIRIRITLFRNKHSA